MNNKQEPSQEFMRKTLKTLQDGTESLRQIMIQEIRDGHLTLEEYNFAMEGDAPITQEEIDEESK